MTSPNEERKPLFSPDEPATTSVKDVFNHKYFVDVLIFIITNCATPINIALYGKWGVGKSTILNFLDERIEQTAEYKKKFEFVTIDVWKLSPQLLRQEFLEELNRKLDSIKEEKIESDLWHFKEDTSFKIPKINLKSWEFWKDIGLYVIISVVLVVIGIIVNFLIESHNILTPSIIISVTIPIFLAMMANLREISKSGKKIIPRIESSHKFHLLFQEIIEKYNNQKLVIAIDNLDRCDDESVVQILNMIKTFLNESNCIFIISCDQDAIVKHLVQKKGLFYEDKDAIEFLTKFFQLTLHIPPQIDGQLHSYAQEQLDVFSSEINLNPDIVDVLVAGITKNPRKIKQFVYNFVIAFKLADNKERKGILTDKIITSNAPFLAKIIVLRDEWPDFFRQLEQNYSLLAQLENYIDNESPKSDSPIGKILEKNRGLEYFLKSTSLIKSMQILPFIQLDQESFESSISESETLILKVNQNDYNYVIEILSKATQEEQHDYILKITNLCKQYIKDKRIQVAYNSIDILLKIYDMIPDKSKEIIIKFLSIYMNIKEMLDHILRFDTNLLFPLVVIMKKHTKEILLQKYADAINPYNNNMSVSLIHKFIEHIDYIPTSISKNVDYNLHLLGQQNNEIFFDCLDILKINETVTRKFVQEKSMDELINRIQPAVQDRIIKLYLELKHVANEKNQINFVKKITSSIKNEKTNSMTPSSVTIFNMLKEFTRVDFTGLAAQELYMSIKHLITQYANPSQKNIVFEILLKIYLNLPKETQKEFVAELLVPHISQQLPQNLPLILEITRREKIQILEHDKVINIIFARFQKTSFSELSMNFVLVYTPNKKWDIVSEKLIQLIKSLDIERLQIVASSYNTNFSKIPKKIRSQIVEQVILTSQQFNPNQNHTIYTILSVSLEGVSKEIVEQIVDVFLNLITVNDPNQFKFSMTYLQNSFVYTSPDKKNQIIELVLKRFQNTISSNQNIGTTAFDFLVNFNDEMTFEYKNIFYNLIIHEISTGTSFIPHILDSFEKIKFGTKKELVYSALENLQNSPNDNIRNKIKELMGKQQTDNI